VVTLGRVITNPCHLGASRGDFSQNPVFTKGNFYLRTS